MKAIALLKSGQIISGELNLTKKGVKFDTDNQTIVKSLEDVEDFNQYKNFMDCRELLGLKLNKKETNEFLKSLGMKELYFYDFTPKDPNVNEFKEYWFRHYNSACLTCIKDCKQSSRVKVITCKGYEANK